MVPIEREDRSFVGCGEEEYPKGDITPRTAPVGLGIHGEVLPEQVSLRLQYGELMQEKATRTGCGGEGYMRGEAEFCPSPVSPVAIPTRQDILAFLRRKCLNPNVEYYVCLCIRDWARDLSSDGSSQSLLEQAMRAQFPEFWGGNKLTWNR